MSAIDAPYSCSSGTTPTKIEALSTDLNGEATHTKEEEKLPSINAGNSVHSVDPAESMVYIKGARLYLITVTFSIILFLTNLEIPIVTTSLLSITMDLNSFNQNSWIISAYMLGYVSMIIIWAKLSDILGRKLLATTTIVLFTMFSGACGGSQTMTQLVIFRAFQGLGGGGNFALAAVIFAELVPKESFPKYTSGVSVVYSISLILGPIIGGALNHPHTWRWVFLLNVPIGAVCIGSIICWLPADFPYQGQSITAQHHHRGFRALLTKETVLRVDFVGAALLLVATTFLVAALEEAGQTYAWNSAFVIALLTISGISRVMFIFWERINTLRSKLIEPVFPWRLMKSRIWAGMILNALFLGAPWFVTIFQLPQRFQIVNDSSAISAGLRLIPFTAAAPIGSGVSAAIAGKFKVPPLYLVIGASCLQVIGFALLSTLPLSNNEANAQYGYQIIAGFGVGINISTLTIMTPYSIEEEKDMSTQAVALGSVTQFRIMGGVIGLAIVTAAYKGYIKSNLANFLTPNELSQLLESAQNISLFSANKQDKVRSVFAGGYNLQFRILIAFAAAQIPSSVLMWRRNQIRI